MMGEGMVVFLGLAVWLGLGAMREADRRETMIEAGVPAVAAARAARYGREVTRPLSR